MSRPHPAYFLVAAFAAGGLLGYVLGAAERKRMTEANAQASAPTTEASALARLEEKGLVLYVVSIHTQGDPRSGLYLCERPRPRADLELLRKIAGAPGWDGVVQLQRYPWERSGMPEQFADWGKQAARIGPLVLFGDPRLVRRVAEALLD